MEEVIKKIIDIEEKAQKVVDDALEEKRLKEEEHMLKILKLEDTIVNDAKRKVEQIRIREFDEIRDKENEKILECDKKLQAMEQLAAKNMDQWVDELVKRVLS